MASNYPFGGIPLSTAGTWNVPVDYTAIVDALVKFLCSKGMSFKVLVPGCGRGRVIRDLVQKLVFGTNKCSKLIVGHFDCVDIKVEELDAFKEFLRKECCFSFTKGNIGTFEKYKGIMAKGKLKLTIHLIAAPVQSFLSLKRYRYKYNLIMPLLFFHYVPDCWVSVLFELLKHLVHGGAFLVDKIVGWNYRSSLLMRSLDANDEPSALGDGRRTVGTYFSVRCDESRLFKECGYSKEKVEEFKQKLKKLQSFFALKVKERQSFWGASIKATDNSVLCKIIENIFASEVGVESGTFSPVFQNEHVSWLWGEQWERMGDKCHYPEDVIQEINSGNDPFFLIKFEFCLYHGFKGLNKIVEEYAYSLSMNEAMRQFFSIPCMLTEPYGDNYSIEEGSNFSRNVIPQCMIQTLLSSGILSAQSSLGNVFLCFNPPTKKVSLVQNLAYAVNKSNNAFAARQFLANAAYHAGVLKKSLSSTLFEMGRSALICLNNTYTSEVARFPFDKYGIDVVKVNKRTHPLSLDCKSFAEDVPLRFMMHWGLGNIGRISEIKSFAPLYIEAIKGSFRIDQDDLKSVPLEIMGLDAILFVPFLGYRYLDHKGNLAKADNAYLGLVLGIQTITLEAIKEALRVAKFATKLAVRANDSQLALYWCAQSEMASVRSAVGSIMSRNGSHNIGSHVLSALAHNVGTMPDDRVLYQYIQHRMDYIATATTEFPTWTVPTMFVAGLMKTFYSQKHLLDYISRSEGLRAYKFQDRNLDDVTRMNQYGTIRIFVRKFFNLGTWGDKPLPQERTFTSDPFGHPWCIHYFFGEKGRLFHTWTDGCARKRHEVAANGGTVKFLEYDGTCEPDWKHDVRIAIPGGVVGQHAFYTIIENVIRNAAKHSWANGNRAEEKDLEINVDFEDRGEHIVFTIGDNISNVFGETKELREFWKEFFKWMKDAPLNKWYDLLNKVVNGSLGSKCKYCEENESDVILKCAWDKLSEWHEADEKEVKSHVAVKAVEGLLFRAFVAPLTASDAIGLATYLDKENGNSDDEEGLPLIYKIQREFLKEPLPGEVDSGDFVNWGVACHKQMDASIANAPAQRTETRAAIIAPRRRWTEYKDILASNASKISGETNIERRLILPLHHEQHCKIAQSFIDSYGKLRKENWGLAEMKISAGYLGQKTIEEIGGLNGSGADILVPIAMPAVCRSVNSNNCMVCSKNEANGLECGGEEGDCPARSPCAHLGYSFKIPKAKNVLVIAKDDTDLKDIKLAICGGVNTDSWHEVGIDFRTLSDDVKSGKKDAVNGEQNLNYRYVVFSCAAKEAIDNQKEQVQGQPNKNQETIEYTDKAANSTVAKDAIVERFCFRQLKLCKQEGKYELRGVCPKGANPVRIEDASPEAFLRAVYSAWLRSLAAERKAADVALISKPISLNLNVSGNEDGREKGLVTTQNLLHTMFIECGHSAFMDFYENPPEGLALCDTTRNIVMLLSLIRFCERGECDSCSNALEVIPESTKPYGESLRTAISKQLAKCCDFLKDGIPLSDEFIAVVREIVRYVPGQRDGESSLLRKIGTIRNDFEMLVAQRLMAAKSDENDTVRNGCEELAEFLLRTDKRQLDGWLDAFHGDGDSYEAFDNYREVSYEKPHDFVSNLKAVLGVCAPPAKQEFDALIESLYAMFLASDVYLRKYEERIATLPTAYKAIGGKGRGTGEAVKRLAREVWNGKSGDTNGVKGDPFVIKYSRHDATRPKDAIYSEALSGSQSYLNMLTMLAEESWAMDGDADGEQGKDPATNNSAASKEVDVKKNEKIRAMGQIARLLENAFLRILIIDERVANFLKSHRQDRMIETFSNMNIRVVDVEKVKVDAVDKGGIPMNKGDDALYEVRPIDENIEFPQGEGDNFDLLIIHQGVIDKWWGKKHDDKAVGTILSNIRNKIPRIVITTGRGRPDNIPNSARVLPFSCIESSLFKRYPEKLVLTSTVLNILPGKSDEEKGA